MGGISRLLLYRMHSSETKSLRPVIFESESRHASTATSWVSGWEAASVFHDCQSAQLAILQPLCRALFLIEMLHRSPEHFVAYSHLAKRSKLTHVRSSRLPRHTRLMPILRFNDDSFGHPVHCPWVVSAVADRSCSWAARGQVLQSWRAKSCEVGLRARFRQHRSLQSPPGTEQPLV